MTNNVISMKKFKEKLEAKLGNDNHVFDDATLEIIVESCFDAERDTQPDEEEMLKIASWAQETALRTSLLELIIKGYVAIKWEKGKYGPVFSTSHGDKTIQ